MTSGNRGASTPPGRHRRRRAFNEGARFTCAHPFDSRPSVGKSCVFVGGEGWFSEKRCSPPRNRVLFVGKRVVLQRSLQGWETPESASRSTKCGRRSFSLQTAKLPCKGARHRVQRYSQTAGTRNRKSGARLGFLFPRTKNLGCSFLTQFLKYLRRTRTRDLPCEIGFVVH